MEQSSETIILQEFPYGSRENVNTSGVGPEVKIYEVLKDKDIEERVKQIGRGKREKDFFYYLYAMGGNLKKVNYHEEQYRQYNEQVEEIMVGKNQPPEGVEIKEVNNWLYFIINGDCTSNDSVGKLYFNLKPSEIVNFLGLVLKKFGEKGLQAQIKIPREGDSLMFNRRDKVVLYFEPDKAEEVLETLEDLHDTKKFNDGVPLFAAEVKNKKGEVMRGVGFGEEQITRKRSFGDVRAEILILLFHIMEEQEKQGGEIDFKKLFGEVCSRYGVDPENPFLSKPKSGQRLFFEKIKDRLQNQTGGKKQGQKNFFHSFFRSDKRG